MSTERDPNEGQGTTGQTPDDAPGAGTPNPDAEALGRASDVLQEDEGQDDAGQQDIPPPPETPPEKPAPNIKLAHGRDPITVSGYVNIGGGPDGSIILPTEEEQRAGFYLKPEQAALLLTQYPGTYKTLRTGGQSKHEKLAEALAGVEDAEQLVADIRLTRLLELAHRDPRYKQAVEVIYGSVEALAEEVALAAEAGQQGQEGGQHGTEA